MASHTFVFKHHLLLFVFVSSANWIQTFSFSMWSVNFLVCSLLSLKLKSEIMNFVPNASRRLNPHNVCLNAANEWRRPVEAWTTDWSCCSRQCVCWSVTFDLSEAGGEQMSGWDIRNLCALVDSRCDVSWFWFCLLMDSHWEVGGVYRKDQWDCRDRLLTEY